MKIKSTAYIRITAIVIALQMAASANAAPLYSIQQLGLTDAEHTRNDNFQSSTVSKFNAAGQVVGLSTRFNGGDTELGESAWIYDGSSTLKIGLFDAAYTRDDGHKESSIKEFNEAGQVIGSSLRYNGGNTPLGGSAWLYNGATTIKIGLTDNSSPVQLNAAGQVIGSSDHATGSSAWLYNGTTTLNIGLTDPVHEQSDPRQINAAGQVIGYSMRTDHNETVAWLYNGSSTLNIGLTDAEHTQNDGNKNSAPFKINEAGQVIGVSNRYAGGADFLGRSAWLYNGSSTVNIGLTGAEHTRNDGYKESWVNDLKQNGQAYGYSERYDGNNSLGRSLWVYNGSSTLKIGLTDAEHTRNDGYQSGNVFISNEAGKIVGISQRFNGGGIERGNSTWLFNGSTTVHIGLTDAEHTKNDGSKYSFVHNFSGALNDAGQVIGQSLRFNGGAADLGQSSWLYDGTTTIPIGLTGAEHTRNDGYQDSQALLLNEAGQAVGNAHRYAGGATDLGTSAWLYDGSITLDVGLTDAEHTRNDGFKSSLVASLNEAGQVVGFSQRYDGAVDMGRDGWVYDPVLATTVPLRLSTRSDGFASSGVTYLGDDGVVLGNYNLYDGMTFLGERALYWSRSDGLLDLGDLVGGGLDQNGWEALYRTIQRNGLHQIVGYGATLGLPGESQSAYLLTPVPEPSTFILAGIAGVALFVVRPRRTA